MERFRIQETTSKIWKRMKQNLVRRKNKRAAMEGDMEEKESTDKVSTTRSTITALVSSSGLALLHSTSGA